MAEVTNRCLWLLRNAESLGTDPCVDECASRCRTGWLQRYFREQLATKSTEGASCSCHGAHDPNRLGWDP